MKENYYNFWFFKLEILSKKFDLDRGQKDPNYFGQVDFNMSSVIGLVFLLAK
jgi:hypothetical protein